MLHVLALGGRIDHSRNSTKIDEIHCVTRDGLILSDCTLPVFQRLRRKRLIASSGGGPYRITRLGRLSVRAQDRRREKDGIKLAQLDEDMGRIRRNLESLDPDLWPYRFLIPVALEGRSMLFFSDAEGALWEGGRSAEVDSAGSILRGVEHGRLVLHDGAGRRLQRNKARLQEQRRYEGT